MYYIYFKPCLIPRDVNVACEFLRRRYLKKDFSDAMGSQLRSVTINQPKYKPDYLETFQCRPIPFDEMK